MMYGPPTHLLLRALRANTVPVKKAKQPGKKAAVENKKPAKKAAAVKAKPAKKAAAVKAKPAKKAAKK